MADDDLAAVESLLAIVEAIIERRRAALNPRLDEVDDHALTMAALNEHLEEEAIRRAALLEEEDLVVEEEDLVVDRVVDVDNDVDVVDLDTETLMDILGTIYYYHRRV